MKKFVKTALMLLTLLFLCACGGEEAKLQASQSRRITVSVTEGSFFQVGGNGVKVEPGGEAVFILYTDPGYVLTGVDYPGPWLLSSEEDGVYRLTLQDVRYPVRVKPELTNVLREITYKANGGFVRPDAAPTGFFEAREDAFVFGYNVSVQKRPNTERGTDLFERPGYTLIAWNTEPDGSGERIGLGSRCTVPGDDMTLYAQWVPWTPGGEFSCREDDDGGVTLTGYSGARDREALVIPARLQGRPVHDIAPDVFRGCDAGLIVLPPGLRSVGEGAFAGSAVREVVLYDDIESISDSAFANCPALSTLSVNVAETHYGYYFRRESVLANKVDLLINNQGRRKAVFYAGCSIWYNLDGPAMQEALGDEYLVVNMGVNGLASSLVQMEIFTPYLEPGDLFFHTPELCSSQQLLTTKDMSDYDDRLWAGLEYNFDLFRSVDIRGMDGVFDSLTLYLSKKKAVDPPYRTDFVDKDGNTYMDETGSVAFPRTRTADELADTVDLDPDAFAAADLSALEEHYRAIARRGVRIYLSCAVVNIDEVPEEHRLNLWRMNGLFRERLGALDGVTAVISDMKDFVFHTWDMYDTNYHLLSAAQVRNTEVWIRDLLAQLEKERR